MNNSVKDKKGLYRLPLFQKRICNADNAWWMNDMVLYVLVLGLSAIDAVTLYTVFDSVLFESRTIVLVLTLGSAVVLNFLPLLLARYLHDYRYGRNGVRPWAMWLILAVFLILFAASFHLRWSARALSFAGAESTLSSSVGFGEPGGISGTDADSESAVAITLLLGILPFITSAVAFLLGYLVDDPVKRAITSLKLQRAEMLQHRAVMLAAADELDRDWFSELEQLDNERFGAAATLLHQGTALQKARARFLLAQQLGDPESINYLTDTEE